MIARWLCVGLAGLLLGGCASSGRPPLELADSLDLERFQGVWYEIAKLPNRFQKQCVADTQAEYTLLDDASVRVVNRCRRADGSFEEVAGRARRPNPALPAALQVRFAPAWMAWLPFVWGDYQVMSLDAQYQWVLVGEPSRRYLWVLARTPRLPQARLDELLAEAARQGFAVESIALTGHTGP